MNKTKLLTAILGLSIAGNAALGIYAAKLNEDVDIAYRLALHLWLADRKRIRHHPLIPRNLFLRRYIRAGSFPARLWLPQPCRQPGDRISVTFTKDQYKNGSGFKKIEVIE
ncbi:hypothetical protein P8884_20960 [Bacillus haynesii]|nr:hypothetical protein [Bacillus haynesii]